MREVTRMLKAIHAQESKEEARKKACDVVEKLRSMRLNEAAKKVEDGIEETLTYMEFPSQHWLKIRTNNVIERMTVRYGAGRESLAHSRMGSLL